MGKQEEELINIELFRDNFWEETYYLNVIDGCISGNISPVLCRTFFVVI